MTVDIQIVSSADYEKGQLNYATANFLQSAQMVRAQQQRQAFHDIQCMLFLKDNVVVGQAVISIRKRWYVFKEALIVQGPLLDYTNDALVLECLSALKNFLKANGIAHVMVNPYLVSQIKDTTLAIVDDHKYDNIIELFKQLGFQHELVPEDTLHAMGQMFVKPLQTYTSIEAIYQDFSPSLKRDLKKFSASHVHVRELSLDEVDVFYNILVATSARKGFTVPSLNYFYQLKQSFGQDVRIMMAYLDCTAYQAYLDEHIQLFTQKIADLEQQPATKKTKGYLTDAKDQLNSYIKRKQTFDALHITEAILPLSSYVFLCYGKEVISIFGGSYEQYLNFGGATLINWEMIQYAYQTQKDYNFYGTIEVDKAENSVGNFHYKSQFGGQLNLMIGQFSLMLNPIFKLLTQLKAKIK